MKFRHFHTLNLMMNSSFIKRNNEHSVKKALNITDHRRGRGKQTKVKCAERDPASIQKIQNRVLWRRRTRRPDPS